MSINEHSIQLAQNNRTHVIQIDDFQSGMHEMIKRHHLQQDFKYKSVLGQNQNEIGKTRFILYPNTAITRFYAFFKQLKTKKQVI